MINFNNNKYKIRIIKIKKKLFKMNEKNIKKN